MDEKKRPGLVRPGRPFFQSFHSDRSLAARHLAADRRGHAAGHRVGNLLRHHSNNVHRLGVVNRTRGADRHLLGAGFLHHRADLVALFSRALLSHHLAHL